MFVACRDFNENEILSRIDNVIELKDYIRSIIPKELAHNTSILSNQMFYIGTQLVDNKSISLELKDKIVQNLMCNVHICGYLDCFVFMSDLDPFLSRSRVQTIYERSKLCGMT